MGWYLRKALNLGLIRINLSKSGLGISAGVKGLRVGAGPRGKYLHAGREGLYYRTSLDSPAEPDAGAPAQEVANSKMDSALNEMAGTHHTANERLAAARWARITARAESLGETNRRPVERGLFLSFLSGIFGGLIRGR